MGEIEVRGVTKKFGNKLVLDNIYLKIPEEKIVGVIGVSGCGKSTLLKILIGFYKPSDGEILYNDKNIEKNMKQVKKDFGFASQDKCFYGKLTVEENLDYFGTMYGLSDKEIKRNSDEILAFLKLEDARKVLAENLSGGMQKRLDLGCALIHFPKVLILDEPIEDLDPSLRKDMIKSIKEIKNRFKTTILISSHLLWELEQLCDTYIVIHDKKVLGVGSLNDLRKRYGKQTEIFVEFKEPNYNELLAYLGSAMPKEYSIDSNKLSLYSDNEALMGHIMNFAKKNSKEIVKLGIKKPDLNEIFEKLTGERS